AGVPGLEKALREMARLARQLRSRRLEEGGLDLDIPEPEVVVDAEGRVTRVRRAPRLFSQQIIEEFMLAANRAVAERLAGTDPSRPDAEDGDRPGMFRVHEPPDPDKLKEVALLLRNLHHQTPGLSSGDPRALGRVLAAARGKAEEAFVNMAVLRAMKLARYDPANLGHFGLGFTHYTHFTSPIRRYPDLIVHRLIRAYGLAGRRGMGRRRLQSLEDRMHTLADEASRLERAAESAERAMLDYKRVQFMRDRVGETFEGKVSGIVRTGFFVTLNEHFVDGFVRLSDLGDDYYVFEEENYRLLGRRTRRTVNLGDAVTIRVDRANLDTRRIDFSLSGPEASGGPARQRGRKTSPPSRRAAAGGRKDSPVSKTEGRRSAPRKRGGTTRKAGRKIKRR
ncbi:MAG: RNB domain-containing ribonuclease, partial [Nitrospinota bacterium]|nr:RNB domain-containing ribonuclease [Nitrospinota bacterium]